MKGLKRYHYVGIGVGGEGRRMLWSVEGVDFERSLKIPQAIPEGKSRRNHFFSLFKKMVSVGFAFGNCMRDFLGHSESLSEAF